MTEAYPADRLRAGLQSCNRGCEPPPRRSIRLARQHPKPGLREMSVERQRGVDAKLAHDRERNAVGQRIPLISVLLE